MFVNYKCKEVIQALLSVYGLYIWLITGGTGPRHGQANNLVPYQTDIV
jgi:hypothetical protein